MQTTLVFDDLRAFVVVAHCRSISEAAIVLRLAQPALSRRLTRLEKCVGKRLVERNFRGIALTKEGRALLEDVQGPVSAVVAIEKSLSQS
ncbi:MULTISPECIES: LysR family transcriptional regulator [Hydrogenophaga]|jgi:LysR family nitrogen assimilation transcriptional regulator|uniref:LysR family transcriptional regulator n=1 Tax=Hydrogenophaga TaxID=47420 RepID=UPI0009EC05D9